MMREDSINLEKPKFLVQCNQNSRMTFACIILEWLPINSKKCYRCSGLVWSHKEYTTQFDCSITMQNVLFHSQHVWLFLKITSPWALCKYDITPNLEYQRFDLKSIKIFPNIECLCFRQQPGISSQMFLKWSKKCSSNVKKTQNQSSNWQSKISFALFFLAKLPNINHLKQDKRHRSNDWKLALNLQPTLWHLIDSSSDFSWRLLKLHYAHSVFKNFASFILLLTISTWKYEKLHHPYQFSQLSALRISAGKVTNWNR